MHVTHSPVLCYIYDLHALLVSETVRTWPRFKHNIDEKKSDTNETTITKRFIQIKMYETRCRPITLGCLTILLYP